MSDQNQSTPTPPSSSIPAGWDESAAFRETSLQLFTRPGDADRLRACGAWLHDLALEAAPIGPCPPATAPPRSSAPPAPTSASSRATSPMPARTAT
jgi:hypothetical protein